MALLLSKVPKQIKDFKSIIKVLIPAGIMAVAIAINNLSTGIIIAGIAIIMVFVVSPGKRKEFAALGVILFGLGLAGNQNGRLSSRAYCRMAASGSVSG